MTSSLRALAAVSACRASRAALHMAGRGGTALPGRLALLLKKDVLADVSEGVRTILVTGTNGKTTTCRMLEQALTAGGREVIANRAGANLLSGITAEFAAAAGRRDSTGKPCAVIECDEGALHLVTPLLKPEVIVVTNLFRDQLDRYGEVMHTREAVLAGIREVPGALLCLNADDSLVASMGDEVPNKVFWFGFGPGAAAEFERGQDPQSGKEPAVENAGRRGRGSVKEAAVENAAGREPRSGTGAARSSEGAPGEDLSDARYCICCGAPYNYHFRTFAHLGAFYCPACGCHRPAPDVEVTRIESSSAEGTSVRMRLPAASALKEDIGQAEECMQQDERGRSDETVPQENRGSGDRYTGVEDHSRTGVCAPPEDHRQTAVSVQIAVPALFNVYNAAAAVCAYTAAGYPVREILQALACMSGSFGRMETFRLGDVRVQMILVKNPAGCNQALHYLSSLKTPFTAVLCLNDLDADGHDISWIWDAEYEALCAHEKLRRVYVWGIRAADLALRLKYGGIYPEKVKIIEKMEDLVQRIQKSRYPVFILPNYTTMLPLRDALGRAAGKKKFWEQGV